MKQIPNRAAKTMILGPARGEALAAIEGQHMTSDQAKRFEAWDRAGITTEEMRLEIRMRYEALAKRK